MARPQKVLLREAELESIDEAHDKLARKLDFPEHYGRNLDALADCLGDVHHPTRVVLERDPQGEKPWFDALVEVICASAQRSCYLGCTIRG